MGFQQNNPLNFKGIPDLDGAQTWLRGIEKNIRVMACSEKQKVQFGTHMLKEEAEDWWDNAHQRIENVSKEITWAIFRFAFMQKYFPKDVYGKK